MRAVDVLDVWLCAHAFKGQLGIPVAAWLSVIGRFFFRRRKMQICSFSSYNSVYYRSAHTRTQLIAEAFATVSLIAEAFAWSFRQRFLPPAATIKIMAEEVDDHRADDDLKVFVSRLPKAWDDETLAAHFSRIWRCQERYRALRRRRPLLLRLRRHQPHFTGLPRQQCGRAVVIGSAEIP